MTTINEPPSPDPEKPNPLTKLIDSLKSSPKKVAGGLIAIAALGSLGYWGVNVLVKKKLPPFLETQIGNFIDRPIDLGEVKGFSLSGIEFGKTTIPPIATDPDKVSLEGVKVGFNLFPVLFRRTLPLDVSLIQPNLYVEQEENGEWLDLSFLESEKGKKDPLLYFDVDLDLDRAQVTAVPYQKNPLTATADGTGRFNQKEELLEYDLEAGIDRAQAQIQGNTKLATGSIDTKLLVRDLALKDAATLLPLPISIDTGELNADLDINIPAWDRITAANVAGTVNLSNLTGKATDLDAEVAAESNLKFNGRGGDISQTQASLGDITAQLDGEVNLDRGYDLNASILPFQLASLPPGISSQLPVPVSGELEAQVKLRGDIKEPKLTGNINNTQTVTVDKTLFKRINADFRADLAEVVLENVEINPVAGGNIIAEGKINTNIDRALKRDAGINVDNMPLAFSFKANLPSQDLISPYYQLPEEVVVGELTARGKIDGTVSNPQGIVKWDLAKANLANIANLEDISGRGTAVYGNNKLFLQDTKITYGDGEADVTAEANLDTNQWQSEIDAESFNLTPFLSEFSNANLNLDRPVSVETAKIDLNGDLNNFDLNKIRGTADLDLNVDGGDVAVDSQLDSGNVNAQVATSNIAIDRFVNNLPVAASLGSGTIIASAKLPELLEFPNQKNLNSLKADADLDLIVDGEAVAINSRVDSGIVTANANTNAIDLNSIAPNLPLPAEIKSSQVTASAELPQLLAFAENPNLSTVDARVDADLDVASGKVNAVANLNDNQWQADVNAKDISSQLLLAKFAPEKLNSIPIDNINAQADLTGDIQPLIKGDRNIPVAINNLTVNSGEQQLNAKGDLTLSDIISNPDLAQSDLDVTANIDLDALPVKEFLAATTQDSQLIADSVNITGQAQFNGQFNGKNLISAPKNPENIDLTGKLNLQNFAFNDIAFEPTMGGDLTVKPDSQIALNLKGKQDAIAATALPCQATNCQLPYLPTNLELRQGENTDTPILATGSRRGDKFALDINNFPLSLLNLAPGKAAGIDGALAGKTTGNIELDFNTLAAQGNIAIADPGLSYIKADELNADFNYDPASNTAELTSSSLDLGNSQYNLNAALDLQSGEIEGKLNIPEAYIQDILTTLRWFTIEDIIRLFDIPDYTNPAAVKPKRQINVVDRNIARKLNQLRKINRQIQVNAAQKEKGNIPNELDIQGKYTGEIVLGGTIETPQAEFNLKGNNWQWQPTAAYPNIVPPLGLVIEESQRISIPNLLARGKLKGTEVNLDKAGLQIQDAALSLSGKLSPEKFDTKFAVSNLTIDNIANFVEIPVDLTGKINTVGTIKGTIEKPNLEGKIAFSDGAFNGNLLPQKIAGDYNYDGSKLGFNTTAPDSIQVEAKVPYPIVPGKSDRVYAKVDLDKEAFIFLSPLSQNYLNWVGGEGDAELEANARIDLAREGIFYDLDADGTVNLEDADIRIDTPFFSEEFIGTGKISLKNQIVNVEALEGTFAEKDLSITGKLPILKTVKNLQNPLTIDLPPGKIDIDRLYKGGVEGQVTVMGASLKPVIGGIINLENGKASIPKTEEVKEDAIRIVKKQASQAIPQLISNPDSSKIIAKASNNKSSNSSSFITALQDFQINLQEFKLEQTPIYKFQLDGALTLNGTVDEPSNIIPKGTLLLTKANVNLFSNDFKLARNLENTIVFTPEAGILNPTVNASLRTEVENIKNQDELNDLRSVESNSNEIDDPITNIDRTNTIRISLVVDGEAGEILPNLAQKNLDCNIRPNDAPLVEDSQFYREAELNRLTACFNGGNLTQTSDRNLVDSQAVSLTSTPSLEQGEIIGLLSERIFNSARELTQGEGLSQERIFDLGVNRFIIDPALDSVLSRVENRTVDLGKRVGLDYFTVYPDVEGTYEINKKSSLRFTYDYNLLANVSNFFDDETSNSNEIRVLYQLNF